MQDSNILKIINRNPLYMGLPADNWCLILLLSMSFLIGGLILGAFNLTFLVSYFSLNVYTFIVFRKFTKKDVQWFKLLIACTKSNKLICLNRLKLKAFITSKKTRVYYVARYR